MVPRSAAPVATRISRRRFTRAAAMVVGGGLGGALLAGCRSQAAPVGPTAVQTKTTIIAELSWQGSVNYVPTVKQLTEQFIDTQWTSKHKGVAVETRGWRGDGSFVNGNAAITDVLAGRGPDILMTCCTTVPVYIEAGIVKPLDALIKRDNIDVSALFPAGVMQSMRSGGVTYGFPDYGSSQPLYYNKGMLDSLGFAYPQPDWTYTQAADLWTRIAGKDKSGKWRYGANLPTEASGSGQWLVHGWGGRVLDETRTRCLLDSSECVAAYDWLSTLTTGKAVAGGLWTMGSPPDLIAKGTVGFSPACCGTLEQAALTLGSQFKWDLIPMPKFPSGSTDFIGNGFYGLSTTSKNDPDLVWELFKFITTTSQWQLFFNAQLALQPPILIDPAIWADWEQIVQRVAPPLKGKNLQAYQQSMTGAYDWAYFQYSSAAANSVWVKYEGQILSGKMTAAAGLHQATDQINAIETSAAAAAVEKKKVAAEDVAQESKLSSTFAQGKASGTFPAPARTGAGAAPVAAPKQVQVQGQVYTLTAAGAGIEGAATNCLLDAVAGTQYKQTFTCRVRSVANVSCPVLSGTAMVGLMARFDLSDQSPTVWIAASGQKGVVTGMVPLAGKGPQEHGPSNETTGSGLVSGQLLTYSNLNPRANYLRAPIWLRVARDGGTWALATSRDGSKWSPAGTWTLDMGGAWVGVFASAGNSEVGGKGQIQAIFDHLDFAPNTPVVVGKA